jgi:hypothetical protein
MARDHISFLENSKVSDFAKREDKILTIGIDLE